jgi:hypothetical protein
VVWWFGGLWFGGLWFGGLVVWWFGGLWFVVCGLCVCVFAVGS